VFASRRDASIHLIDASLRDAEKAGRLPSPPTDAVRPAGANTMKYANMLEEELKATVAKGFFRIRNCLLVPQDVRERKGSFYTPQIWVELSQKYMADVFGENWQDEYVIWDCAAGTGNLLVGLTNKYNIWASTIDKADVDVMQDRIKNGAELLPEHVFQFDFLNDSFDKLPVELKKIIKEKPENLIIYINPPYAEATSIKTVSGVGQHKAGVTNTTETHKRFVEKLGKSAREMYVQFLIRCYVDIRGCKICNFSKLKAICSANYESFRDIFNAKLESLFLCPADTFDNVRGQFPIGFHIWDTKKIEKFSDIEATVYDKHSTFISFKKIYSYDNHKNINDWLKRFIVKNGSLELGAMCTTGVDFQTNNKININQSSSLQGMGNAKGISKFIIKHRNIFAACIYFTARKVIAASWINDRDIYRYPTDGYKQDLTFQTDCLTFTLFHNSNNVSAKNGTNHWIPFSEREVNARDKYESSFMTDFISGKQIKNTEGIMYVSCGFEEDTSEEHPMLSTLLVFSDIATAVFDAARQLWKYYHSQKKSNPKASFYDIREHFQGRGEGGRMNPTSDDEMYNKLLNDLRQATKLLGEQIKPKIYEYGFLM